MNKQTLKEATLSQLEELQDCQKYAEFIMKNGDPSERVICNGHTLLEAQYDGYLFEEFLNSIGLTCE
jgi:hypothetical protein